MKELIKVIAFDADDTLWSNEPFFQEVEKQYTDLLKPYGTSKEISAALFQTEMNNLQILGYGAKAFTISMVETALQISNGKIAADIIRQIVDLGKSLLKMPIELLPGVKETLKTLKETGKYKLVVATKGDLLDQENIAGYDGITIAKILEPKLTTLCQNTVAIGRIAAEKLIDLIENPKTTLIDRFTVDGTLFKGASVKQLLPDK